MSKKQTPQVRPDAPEPEELPEWLSTTPEHEETGYCLQVDHANEGIAVQEVKVTREEYEWLKQSLAARRGLVPTSDAPEVQADTRQVLDEMRAAQNGAAADTISKPEPPEKRELPYWLTEVEPCTYTLVMYDPGGGELQAVWMEHEEYENLRNLLGCFRIGEQGKYAASGVDDEIKREMIEFASTLDALLSRAPAMVEAFGYLLAEEEEEEPAQG